MVLTPRLSLLLGWYIAYIDRDPATIARQQALEKKKKSDMDEQERELLRIQKQIEEVKKFEEQEGHEAGEEAGENETKEGKEVSLDDEGKKVAFSFGKVKKENKVPFKSQEEGENADEAQQVQTYEELVIEDGRESDSKKRKIDDRDRDRRDREHDRDRNRDRDRDRDRRDKERDRDRDRDRDRRDRDRDRNERRRDDKEEEMAAVKKARTKWDMNETTASTSRATSNKEKEKQKDGKQRGLSSLEQIMRENEKRKEHQTRHDYWLTPGIVVKIMHKTVGGGKYYKQKAVVKEVEGKYVAQVSTLDSGDVLRLDQDFLETVLPAIGGRVKILNGPNRGQLAQLKAIDVDKFCATVQLVTGVRSGDTIAGVEYEDIAKVADKQ